MKKVRKIKILVTTREILAARSEVQDLAGESGSHFCPICHSRLAETVNSALAALTEPGGNAAESATEHDCQKTEGY